MENTQQGKIICQRAWRLEEERSLRWRSWVPRLVWYTQVNSVLTPSKFVTRCLSVNNLLNTANCCHLPNNNAPIFFYPYPHVFSVFADFFVFPLVTILTIWEGDFFVITLFFYFAFLFCPFFFFLFLYFSFFLPQTGINLWDLSVGPDGMWMGGVALLCCGIFFGLIFYFIFSHLFYFFLMLIFMFFF